MIEILVVVGIVAMVMAISIPSIYRSLHPESLQRTVKEIKEICNTARSQAILDGRTTEVVINTLDRSVTVRAASAPARPEISLANQLESPDVSGHEWRMGEPSRASSASGGNDVTLSSTKIPERIQIEGIRLNMLDYTEDEIVRVRFYENGTCDEFSLFLTSDQGERRQISLEVSTGMVDIESDPTKFR